MNESNSSKNWILELRVAILTIFDRQFKVTPNPYYQSNLMLYIYVLIKLVGALLSAFLFNMIKIASLLHNAIYFH